MSNLWIFILTPTTQGSAITIICPDKVTSSLTSSNHFTSKIYHQPALLHQGTSTYPHTEDHVVTMHVSLDKGNLNTINISTPYLRSLSHSSTTIRLARVNLSHCFRSIGIWKDPLLMEAPNTPRDLHRDYWYDIHCMHRYQSF